MKNKCLSLNDCFQMMVDNNIVFVSVNATLNKRELSMQFKDNQYCCQSPSNSASIYGIYNCLLTNNIKHMELVDKKTIECVDFDGNDYEIEIGKK